MEPYSECIFPWASQPFHFKMFSCYRPPKVPDNEEKGKRRGCKQTWSLSNQSVSLGLFYFQHCKPFDSDRSPLCTSHRWRNKSKDYSDLGFLLSPPVPMDENSSWAAGHGSAGCPSPGVLVLRFPADIVTGSINQPIKADRDKAKNTIKAENSPCPPPSSTLAPNWCTTQDAVAGIAGRWSVVRGDEVSQCGSTQKQWTASPVQCNLPVGLFDLVLFLFCSYPHNCWCSQDSVLDVMWTWLQAH